MPFPYARYDTLGDGDAARLSLRALAALPVARWLPPGAAALVWVTNAVWVVEWALRRLLPALVAGPNVRTWLK